MSTRETTETTSPAAASVEPAGWHVRLAGADDVDAVAGCVRELLVELGAASPPSDPALADVARALIDDPRTGAVLVAEAGDEVVGVLAASWQSAMHVPGRYAVIQDLWVKPSWRSRKVGAELIAALVALAHRQGVPRIEVGLPKETFARIEATTAFYVENGFRPLGPRMRRVIA
jgi:GNAT superfamily N-acetyltransferase